MMEFSTSSRETLPLDLSVDRLIETYLSVSAIRPAILFRHFLPAGYRQTTLDSVSPDLFDATIFAKIHLGMLITLYDDLADHPRYRNSRLLFHLYRLNLDQDERAPLSLRGQDKEIFELARYLFTELGALLRLFPNSELLESALRFDIEQFYNCNRHSELMAELPAVCNLTESRVMGPHNMGIVAAGMIDLMASPEFQLEELGACREIFHLGQRLGRISNLLFTFAREIAEGDLSNEILISRSVSDEAQYSVSLHTEFEAKLNEIRLQKIRSFRTTSYANGLADLHLLHASLEGRI